MIGLLSIFLPLTLFGIVFEQQYIQGRWIIHENSKILRKAIYTAKVPEGWIRQDSLIETIGDTTQPLVTFLIPTQKTHLRLTVHNFAHSSVQRMSPIVHIERWKKQFSSLQSYEQLELSSGGFAGFFFEGIGELNHENQTMLAWIMQLDNELFQMVDLLISTPLQIPFYQEIRADYTIKVSGHCDSIQSKKEEILFFADNFELINPLPKLR